MPASSVELTPPINEKRPPKPPARGGSPFELRGPSLIPGVAASPRAAPAPCSSSKKKKKYRHKKEGAKDNPRRKPPHLELPNNNPHGKVPTLDPGRVSSLRRGARALV